MTYLVQHVDDSFELLRRAKAGTIDHIITDPPYDAHVQDNQVSGTAMRQWVDGEIAGSGIPKKSLPFAPIPDYAFLADFVRIARRWTICFSAVEGFGEARRVLGPAYVRGGIWYKPNAQGQMTGDRPAACYEGIICAHDGKKRWNGRGGYGLWVCNGTRGKKDRHPNEKPLSLCLKLVALFTDRGETVFDPFCGSGAIGEACVLLGRHYIGFDSSAEWVEKARARLEQASYVSVTDADALVLCTARKSDILGETGEVDG